MVKTYLSYTFTDSLGQITNSKFFALSKDNKIIYTSFNDYVMGFDLKSGLEVFKFHDQNVKITSLHILSNTLIIGYDNGSLYLFQNLLENSNKKDIIPIKENRSFIHQKGILCINNNLNESRLVIGSVDKLISVVDIISNLVVYKLSGHKEKINEIAFYKNNEQFILSLSEDFCFKIWDTNIQKCIYTYSDTANKLTSFINLDNILLFGTFSQEINIYEINLYSYIESDIENKLNYSQSEILVSKGNVKKQSNNKTLSFYSNEEVFIVLSNDGSIEMFKILKKKEIKAKLIKYYMTKKKINFLEAQSAMMEIYKQKKYDYKFRYKSIFKFEENSKKNSKKKIISIFLLDNYKFGYITNQNNIEIYKYFSNLLTEKIYSINNDTKKVETLDQEKDDLSVKKVYSIGQNIGGHHTQVNIIKYSPSNQEFFSVSNDEIKLWGGKNLNQSLKSQNIKNITCVAFEQDINIIILGTKNGNLYLINMVSLEMIKIFEKIHSAQISDIITLPYREEKRIIITCSNDKTIKFWNLDYNNEDNTNSNINLDYESEMNALESVICAKVTPDLNFFSYALYDNTIKIYYFDTMKFHLSLYGHKMPVTQYDISSDGNLIVSGGLDKSIKIWGMDYGDCHKTLPAHSDIVTCVKFIQDTHFFISCSKDCSIKYYDADTFEFIQLLNNDLFCNQFLYLDINSEGTQILASCNDNSIKIFNLSQEQVVPKLTQQELLEKNMIKEQEKEFNNMNNNTNNINEENANNQMIKKMDHLTYAENLIEKLNLCEKFKDDVIQYNMEIDEFIKNSKIVADDESKIKDVKIYNLNISMEKPKPNIFFFGKNIFQIILEEIKKIPYFDLENVLNNISYSYFQKLVYYFEHYIRKNIEIELIGRCIIFFCTLYESQISNDKVISNYLRSIYMRLQGRFKLKYSLIKFNQKSIELIIKKFQDFQKNKNFMNEEKNHNILGLEE